MFAFFFFTYLFIINVVAFGLYAYDKHHAVYTLWRIPEAVLLISAAIGGAYGAGMGMLLFRHKTLHTLFLIIVPTFFVLWMGLLIFLCV